MPRARSGRASRASRAANKTKRAPPSKGGPKKKKARRNDDGDDDDDDDDGSEDSSRVPSSSSSSSSSSDEDEGVSSAGEGPVYGNDDKDDEKDTDAMKKIQELLAGPDFQRPLLPVLALRTLRTLVRNVDGAHAWLAALPRLGPADQDRFFAPATMDATWAQADEDLLQQDLAADPIHQALDGVKIPGGNNLMRPLWAKTMAQRGYLPTDVVGPRRYLAARTTQPEIRNDGRTHPSPVWPAGFCRRLARLTLGGPTLDPRLLSVLILWTVACRTDDRRRIPFNPGRDGRTFYRLMREALAETDGSRPITAIHEDVRQLLTDAGEPIPWVSMAMRKIERQAFRRGDDDPPTPVAPCFTDFVPLVVETEDLLLVENALNSVMIGGFPLFANIGSNYRIAANKHDFAYPKQPRDFQSLWRRDYEQTQRWSRRQARLAETQDGAQDGLEPFTLDMISSVDVPPPPPWGLDLPPHDPADEREEPAAHDEFLGLDEYDDNDDGFFDYGGDRHHNDDDDDDAGDELLGDRHEEEEDEECARADPLGSRGEAPRRPAVGDLGAGPEAPGVDEAGQPGAEQGEDEEMDDNWDDDWDDEIAAPFNGARPLPNRPFPLPSAAQYETTARTVQFRPFGPGLDQAFPELELGHFVDLVVDP